MQTREQHHTKLPTIVQALVALLFTFLIAGCAKPDSPTPTEEIPPTLPASPTPTVEEDIAPTEKISDIPTEQAADSNCIACHSDKDRLISTADPVEEKESESSGEG